MKVKFETTKKMHNNQSDKQCNKEALHLSIFYIGVVVFFLESSRANRKTLSTYCN